MLNSVLFALGIALSQDTAHAPVFAAHTFEQADSIGAAEFAKDSLGSITVGIVSGSRLVWTKSYGFADSARTRRADSSTVYRIASVSKQFTAIMLLQLVDRKQVQLSDPAERFFPEIKRVRGKAPGSAPVTLLQLATMTSGLARDPDNKRASGSGGVAHWIDTLISSLSKTRYITQPGIRYGYSNIGYGILAAALSRAARESYVHYQDRNILRPLGMSSSAFELDAVLMQRLAVGVDFDELVAGKLNYADAADDNRNGLGANTAAGGLYSTVTDVAKLVSLELGFGPSNVLTSESLKLRDAVPVAANSALTYGYGIGSQIYRWGDTVAVGHSGNLAGYTSMILYDRNSKFGVIVLRSAAGGEADAGRLAGRVFRRLRREDALRPEN